MSALVGSTTQATISLRYQQLSQPQQALLREEQKARFESILELERCFGTEYTVESFKNVRKTPSLKLWHKLVL
jgi:hypothetical protein